MFDELAQVANESPETTNNAFTSVSDILGVAINIGLGTGIAISIIAMILSGIKFMSSKGDPKSLAQAKNALTYSIIAFILTAGAFTIKTIIITMIGGDYGDIANDLPSF